MYWIVIEGWCIMYVPKMAWFINYYHLYIAASAKGAEFFGACINQKLLPHCSKRTRVFSVAHCSKRNPYRPSARPPLKIMLLKSLRERSLQWHQMLYSTLVVVQLDLGRILCWDLVYPFWQVPKLQSQSWIAKAMQFHTPLSFCVWNFSR